MLLALLAPAAVARAQQEAPELVAHVFALRHQAAGDALGLVKPLLSQRGTVELRPGANTLVLHDTMEALERILPVLIAFDHPSRPVDVDLWLVRAVGPKVPVSPQPPTRASNVPPELLKALTESVLRYEQYTMIGSSNVRGEEGEKMTFQVGGNYVVRFRLGTMVGGQRLRLNDFEVMLDPDGGTAVPLVKSQLNLWLGRTMVLALSPGEGSGTALLVMVRCQAVAQAAPKKGGHR